LGPPALPPLRRKAYWGFFFALKNPKASTGFEPANLGTRGRYASSADLIAFKFLFVLRGRVVLGDILQGEKYFLRGQEIQPLIWATYRKIFISTDIADIHSEMSFITDTD
jgi:hypothetical protein